MTPARQQYLRLKAQHPDAVLLYRMGDFYEMFDEDAHTAARILGITLTGRDFGRSGRIPMAGIPHHALNGYLRRLLRAGCRLAICEQMTPAGNGLVEREVVRILSPGTVDDPALLDSQRANDLLAVATSGVLIGLVWVDVSTGASEYRSMHADDTDALHAFIDVLQPAEIIATDDAAALLDDEHTVRVVQGDAAATAATSERFPLLDDLRPAVRVALDALVGYLTRGHATLLDAIEYPQPWNTSGIMVLDHGTRQNLAIDLRQRGTPDLFSFLNETRTAAGARMLRRWLERPLLDLHAIEARHTAIDELRAQPDARDALRATLKPMLDLERITTRIVTGTIRPRDLLGLAETLHLTGQLRHAAIGATPLLTDLADGIDPCPAVVAAIQACIDPDSEHTVSPGFDLALDAVRDAIATERAGLKALETDLRAQTGLRSLKVGFNKVFGYYIEVSKTSRGTIPPEWDRRQTLTNAERYMTPSLREAETRILAAESRATEMEAALLQRLLQTLRLAVPRIRVTAQHAAQIDVLQALATVADTQRWVRPTMTTGSDLVINAGRHPLVERDLDAGAFIANDTVLDDRYGRMVILTGPNMGGKSTWLRQTALIVFLAQIGSLVPADRADIGLVDRIFTRIGASDDIARGQSTFMVEMLETAAILEHATGDSLIVLDEIGRGTSAEDGVAIAHAVIERIARTSSTRTLFATHFRELADLPQHMCGVRAMHTAVVRRDGQLVFLHRIEPGVADAAFGLEIARLAGLPADVLQRAASLMESPASPAAREARPNDERQARNVAETALVPAASVPPHSAAPTLLPLPIPAHALGASLAKERVMRAVLEADLARTTPLDALNLLADLQERLRQAEQLATAPRAIRTAEGDASSPYRSDA